MSKGREKSKMGGATSAIVTGKGLVVPVSTHADKQYCNEAWASIVSSFAVDQTVGDSALSLSLYDGHALCEGRLIMSRLFVFCGE